MKFRFSKWALILGLAIGVSACDEEDDTSGITVPNFYSLQVIHASPDAPDVNVLLNGSAAATDLSYKQSSGLLTLNGTGPANIEVQAQLPGGNATVIPAASLPFADDTTTSVIAVGTVGGADLDAVVITNPTTPVGAGNVRIQAVHGAPNVAIPVDVYVTGPMDDILPMMPTGTFDFGQDIGPVEVPAGDYRIRVVVPADATKTPVFDSGTVALPAGADFMIVAVQNTNVGAGAVDQSPISLFATADGVGDLELVHAVTNANVTATPSAFRAAHFSPDTPAVNVLIANGAITLNNVSYPQITGFTEVDAGTYNVKIELVSNPGAYAIDEDVTLTAGKRYSVFAADYTAGLIADGLFAFEDDLRPLATGAKVRIIHLAPGAGLVDIYVTPQGAGIVGATPAATGVDFKDDLGYVQLAGDDYDVTVTLAGTQNIAIPPVPVTVVDGEVYTVLARDAAGGGNPFALELIFEP
jgi:hypothetical protein